MGSKVRKQLPRLSSCCNKSEEAGASRGRGRFLAWNERQRKMPMWKVLLTNEETKASAGTR